LVNGSSLFKYEGVIKAGIQGLKYQFLTSIEPELKELIKEEWLEEELKNFIKLKPAVQPMPLYWRRYNWRGFNQAELIGRIVAEKFNLRIIDSLIRVKPTKPQAELPRRERLKNTKGVFKIKQPPPKTVLVVDDVWTTGATINEAMRVLRKAGAKRVWGLTLAR